MHHLADLTTCYAVIKVQFKVLSNSTLCVLGQQTINCKYKGSNYSLKFKFILGTQKLLLSGTICKKLGLITVNPDHTMAVRNDCIIAQ